MTESEKTLSHKECSSKGGKLRAEKLSPERRSEIAKIANNARNSKGLQKATHGGILLIGDKEIECGVLPNKTRVISSVSIRNALGLSQPSGKKRKRANEVNLPTFLVSNALNPYFIDVFGKESFVIDYVNKYGRKTQGMKAEFLPKICEIYLLARRENKLSDQQKPIAQSCEIILSALAKVGVIALVDESSGYQEDRARDELQTLLKTFISEDLLPWTQRFPHQFFREVYKIYGWTYRPGQTKHPQCLGSFINKYVYDAISPDVKEELQKRNPVIYDNGKRAVTHHQFLTPDVGIPALDKHLTSLITLLKISKNNSEFQDLFQRLFPENDNNQLDWINKK